MSFLPFCFADQNLLYPFGIEIDNFSAAINILRTPSFLQKLLHENQVVILKNSPFTSASELKKEFSYLGSIVYEAGPNGVYVVQATDEKCIDRVMSSDDVPLHWDGFGTKWQADFQVFLCMNTGNSGGETFFSDSLRVFSTFHSKEKDELEKTKLRYFFPEELKHFSAGTSYDLVTPLVVKHRITGNRTLKFAELPRMLVNKNNLQGFEVVNKNAKDSYAIYNELVSRCYSAENQLSIKWNKGDIVITDNDRLLHGRKAFTGDRKLLRVLFRQNYHMK